jgi:hypothetical protein
MPWIDSLDWSSSNALRRYPLREGSSAQSNNGYFDIPDTLIVDFSLSASSDVSARFYISSIFNKLSSVVIEVSDFSDVVIGTFEINGSAHTLNKDYYLNPTDDYAGANGKITIGVLDDLNTRPTGFFKFSSTATEFEPRTIIPGLRGIDRIKFVDSLNGQYSLTGNITLTSRKNMSFSYAEESVYLDVADGLGLNKQCAVTNCVKTINGVAPDPSSGNISLLGIKCLAVQSPAQYTLEMVDTCCTPCAGCTDLEELTTRLTSLENKFLELKDGYTSVNFQLNNYLSTINSNCACPS